MTAGTRHSRHRLAPLVLMMFMILDIPRSEIAAITARAVGNGVANGALTGAGIGLGAALVVLTAVASGDGYLLPSAKWGAPLLLSGIGGLVGAVIDRAHKRGEVVYHAP